MADILVYMALINTTYIAIRKDSVHLSLIIKTQRTNGQPHTYEKVSLQMLLQCSLVPSMFPERPQRHGNDVCGLLYGQMGGQLLQEDL